MVTSRSKDRRFKRSRDLQNEDKDQLIERVVSIRRVAKVVKGGRNLSFSAFVVIGDEKGMIGYSNGKAGGVPDAVKKAVSAAKRNMNKVVLKDSTVPHEVVTKFGASKVMLRPASPGTGIIAGGGVRAVMEAVGVKDVISKNHGSNNSANVVKATVKALHMMRDLKIIEKERKSI